MNCLLPQSRSFLDLTVLSPLLAGAKCDALKNEILVARHMLNKKFTGVAQVDLSNMGKVLSDYKEAFSELHTPYITAQIIGVSSASCESSFSTLSRVLKSFRPHYAS